MNIETELIHKWGIGDDPVFGSGSLKDIQTLCNECDKLRKHNEILCAEIELLEKAVKFKPQPPMPEAADSDGNAPGKHFGPD